MCTKMINNSNTLDFQTELKRKEIKRNFSVMVKVCGAACNMDCDYCYYIEKDALYSGDKYKMKEDVLENMIKSHIEAQAGNRVEFVWHGGEPTIAGLSYFRNIIDIQNRYKGDKEIANVLQTNGTLINENWCRFLAENNFLCGISIDGPKPFHDKHRRFTNGKGSWDDAMRTIDLFHRYGVDFNTMTVINASNAKHPVAVYDFLKSIGSRYMQFTPIVERIADDENELISLVSSKYQKATSIMAENVSEQDWGNFLCRIFDKWVQTDIGVYFVNYFDATLASYLGQPTGLCTMNEYCACSPAIEHNGDAYCCDHYVFPEFLSGNIMKSQLSDLVKNDKQLFFEEEKIKGISSVCKSCEFLRNCYGDCPKNRINKTKDGEYISALCGGLYSFFKYTKPKFEAMAKEIAKGNAPSNIIK